MILDAEQLFSQGQAVTATGDWSTAVVSVGPGDAGVAERLSLYVTSDPLFTAGTLTVELYTSHTADANVDAATEGLVGGELIATYPITAAELLVGGMEGKLVGARLPHGMKTYLQLKYTGAALTGGKLTAGLVLDVQADEPYIPRVA